MTAVTSVTADLVGKKVQFVSKSANDITRWRGTVDAVGGFKFAKLFGNPIPYNAAVRRTDPTVGEVELLTYFSITLDNDSDGMQVRCFANEWIASNTLEVIDELTQVKITVYDLPSANHNAIIALLKTAGYSAIIDSVG